TRILELLRGGDGQYDRHQQPLALDTAVGARRKHMFEQNALMRDVLIDDPQSVAARGDDEAVVNLAERAEILERFEILCLWYVPAREERAMRIRHAESRTAALHWHELFKIKAWSG